MGGHYGSVQVRGCSFEAIKAAASQVATSMGIKCLIGPALSGWVGIYPENSGQDESVGGAIARLIDGDVLHVLVHDDSIFAYWLWREGKLVDSFHSRPGYFGEGQEAEQSRMSGNPAVLDALAPGTRTEFTDLLSRDNSPVFEVERLTRFGKLLGIRNLVASYEYLKDGETEGIEGWRKFIEVPSDLIQNQKIAAKAKRDELKRRIAALKKNGLLLAEKTTGEMWARTCAGGDGIVVAWYGIRTAQPPLDFFGPPWSKPIDPGVVMGAQTHALASDDSASQLAVSIGQRAILLDARTWRQTAEFEFHWPYVLAMSGDGRLLVLASPRDLAIREIATGALVAQFTREGNGAIAVHPLGQWLAATGNTLGIAPIEAVANFRELVIGGVSEHDDRIEMLLGAVAKVAPEEMEQQWQRGMEKGLKLAQEMGATPERVAAIREKMQKEIEGMRESWRKAREDPKPGPRPGREQAMSVGFSRDGRWFWCGTTHGLRVYEWTSVLRATGASIPDATWSFDTGPLDPRGGSQSHVYSIVEERHQPAVIFAGLSGRILRMDLTNGQTREMLVMPDEGAIISMALTANGEVLATQSKAGFPGGSSRRDEKTTIRLWDYGAMLRG